MPTFRHARVRDVSLVSSYILGCFRDSVFIVISTPRNNGMIVERADENISHKCTIRHVLHA